MLLRSNVLYVGPWWQTLLAPRARPFAQTRLLAIAMRFAKDIRHERTLSFPKYSISAMPPFLQEVDLAVPWMGWSPAEGGKRGRCQCKSTPLLMPLSSLNHICFMIIYNLDPFCLYTWWWTPFPHDIKMCGELLPCLPPHKKCISYAFGMVQAWVGQKLVNVTFYEFLRCPIYKF